MNDNGGTAGVGLYNEGMRGSKGSPWQGGVRAAGFWRWPGTLPPGDVDAAVAHIDILPTLAALAGIVPSGKLAAQIEGRSLVPLLENPAAPWPDRTLVTHTGRWERGRAAAAKYASCAIRNARWKLVSVDPEGVKSWQLFDLKADPGEQHNVAAEHPGTLHELEAAYDAWWTGVQPQLVNENAPVPAENAFRTLYRQQFGGP